MESSLTHSPLRTSAISLCLEAYHSLLFKHFSNWYATVYNKTQMVQDDFPPQDESGNIIKSQSSSLGLSLRNYTKTNAEKYFSGIIIAEDYILVFCDMLPLSPEQTISVQIGLQQATNPANALVLTFQLIESENDGKWPNLRFAPKNAITCQTLHVQKNTISDALVLL